MKRHNRLLIVTAAAILALLVGLLSLHEERVPSKATVTVTWEGPVGGLWVSGTHWALTYPVPGNPPDSTYAPFAVRPSSTDSPITLEFPRTVRPALNGTYDVFDPETFEKLANGSFREFYLGGPFRYNSTRIGALGSYVKVTQAWTGSERLELDFTHASNRDLEMKVNRTLASGVSLDAVFTSSGPRGSVAFDLEFANVTVDGQSFLFERSIRLVLRDFGELTVPIYAAEGPFIQSPVGLSLWCASCTAALKGEGNATYQDEAFPFVARLDLDSAEFLDIEVTAPLSPFRFDALRVALLASSALTSTDGAPVATEPSVTYWPVPSRELREVVMIISSIILAVPIERFVEDWIRREDRRGRAS